MSIDKATLGEWRAEAAATWGRTGPITDADRDAGRIVTLIDALRDEQQARTRVEVERDEWMNRPTAVALTAAMRDVERAEMKREEWRETARTHSMLRERAESLAAGCHAALAAVENRLDGSGPLDHGAGCESHHGHPCNCIHRDLRALLAETDADNGGGEGRG